MYINDMTLSSPPSPFLAIIPHQLHSAVTPPFPLAITQYCDQGALQCSTTILLAPEGACENRPRVI